MKRFILAVILVLVLTGIAQADPPDCISSGLQTADALIMTRSSGSWKRLCGVELIPGAAADATLILYDNTEASGTVIAKIKADAAGLVTGFAPSGFSILVSTGIYADVSGADAAYIVWYRE